METSTKRIRTNDMIRCVKEAGKCELCGSIKGLEAHHIIPVACGGSENHENLICVIVEMVNAAKSAGIELRLVNSTNGDGRCLALAACKRSVQRIGLWQFQQALDTIVQAWGGVQESLSNGFIDGMTEIYATNQTQFDKKELIKKLSQFPPSYYIRESKEYTGSKGKRFAAVFRKVYNRNRRVNVLGA